MKYYFALSLLLLLAGCQSENRFSTHGSEIIQYEGDIEVLRNCCHAAMSQLCGDAGQEEGSAVAMKSTGWSEDGKATARRSSMSCTVDGHHYGIDVMWLNKNKAMVVVDSPFGDHTLLDLLMDMLANHDVKATN